MIYEENDVLYNKLLAKDVWERDLIKQKLAESMGYTYIFVWEYDWKNNSNEVLNKVKDIINDCGN